MPEMPEVETIARNLRSSIIGKRIVDVRLSGLPLRKPLSESFARTLQGRTIRKVHRRGKYLILAMEPHGYLLIHLGMSGRIFHFSRRVDPAAASHTHATIRFSDSTELQYRDHRRFGLLAIYDVARLAHIPELKSLGIDPLGSMLDPGDLWKQLCNSRKEIKAFMLDQKKIAGIGNIYACEALFVAGIHPARRCHSMTRAETVDLVRAIRKVLRAGVRHGGTTFSDFMGADGNPGAHQKYLRVFQREGEECPRCQSRIGRLRQGNRSSYYCAKCQK
jgi:formamidopyrimidine-DNA glycosylase